MFGGWFAKQLNELRGRGSGMHRLPVERQLIGGILGMMGDPRLFRKSDIGRNHEYSGWTSEGREALIKFIEDYSKKLLVAEDQDLNDRAKQLTWAAIKEKAE